MPNESAAPNPTDTWICRIPRALLHALASNDQLRDRERVLLAVIAELHSNRAGGEGKTGGSRLERITGLHRRSVRRALTQLEEDGVLIATEAEPGRMKRFRLTAGASVAPGLESAPPQDQNRATPVAQGTRQVGGANSAPALNEERKERSSLGTDPAAKAAETDDETKARAETAETYASMVPPPYRLRPGEPRGEGEILEEDSQ